MPKQPLVTLTLSNPLDAEQAARVRAAEVKDYRPGDKIRVPSQDAAAIIAAGYARGVEPSDPQSVATALSQETPPPSKGETRASSKS